MVAAYLLNYSALFMALKNKLPSRQFTWKVVAAGSLLIAEIAGAQTYFTADGFGDLVAGFRKTGAFTENSELVVNMGNITNFLALSAGTTINISNYSTTQINDMCPDGLANLQWSAFSAFQPIGFPDGPWVTPVGSFPAATVWYTVPRSDFDTQTTPPSRYSYNAQGSNLRQKILGINTGAGSISQSLSVTNEFNNVLLVNEPVTFTDSILSAFIGDRIDPTLGDFGGQTFTFSVENTTPDPFDSASRSDLYQSVPAESDSPDPFTGTTTGPAYYVGYFTLNTDGTMTFTRAGSSSIPNPPPVPVLHISTSFTLAEGSGSTQANSIISFNTTNGATYTLYYTNAAGLNTPRTNWPSITVPVAGDGAMHYFTNSSTDPSRFYSIGAH